jgi:acetylornithine deacetylase/succinyl-diaminopimelate desuccinylase-like protein
MTRALAIDAAAGYLASGRFAADLDRRVGYRTESAGGNARDLARYLDEEITPELTRLGFTAETFAAAGQTPPYLIGWRIESPDLKTILMYGHGDVVAGMDDAWSAGLVPWQVTTRGDRLYGRGTADNKGQHTICLAALREVIAARGGRLGFNVKILIEMGEEVGSPGLREVCRTHKRRLAADALIASDGPRLSAEQPTLFLGARGILEIRLTADFRAGAHHSGNWGGLIANPATVLAGAIASLVDGRGRILCAGLRPSAIPDEVRQALADIELAPGPDEPAIDPDWSEPDLSPAERVFGWNSLDVLAITAGDPARPQSTLQPVNAIPGRADAMLHLRFVVGTEAADATAAIRRHLDAAGIKRVTVATAVRSNATRLDIADPWVDAVTRSIARTTNGGTAVLPNFGGSLPNDIFVEELGLKTLWLPHSYPGCNQHAPDEHLLIAVAADALRIMAGLFWDLGEAGA